jgi:hypothetical protein
MIGGFRSNQKSLIHEFRESCEIYSEMVLVSSEKKGEAYRT